MSKVYVLQHVHYLDEDREDVKTIGVYSSHAAAEAAAKRLADRPGFRDSPEIRDPEDVYADGFEILEFELNKDHWVEGYVTCYDGVIRADFQKRSSLPVFEFLNKRLAEAGVVLTNPRTNAVTIIRISETPNESVPSQVESSADEIRLRIETGLPTYVQWWFTDYVILMCSFRYLGDTAYIEIDLDWLNNDEYASVLAIITDLFRRLIDDGTAIGLVADRWGETSHFDWDGFFVSGGSAMIPEPPPDLLALPASRISDIDQSGSHNEIYKDFAFVTNDQ